MRERERQTEIEREGAYRLVVGKPENKRPFGKPRDRWENYINIDFSRNLMGGRKLDCSGSE
jgi:hypothetical protein